MTMKNAFDASGPSQSGAALMFGIVAPNKKNGPLITTNPHTTRLIHELRPVRKEESPTATNTLNVIRHSMLKRFGGGSRNLNTFTSGTEQNLVADVAQRHLDELVKAGFIKRCRYESYSITQSGLLALDNYGQASMAASKERGRRPDYVPSTWNVRTGADDHFQHPSVGMNAQIERVGV